MKDLSISIDTLDNYDVLETCLRSVYQEGSDYIAALKH